MQDVCFETLASFLRNVTKIFLYFKVTLDKGRAYKKLNKCWLIVPASHQ